MHTPLTISTTCDHKPATMPAINKDPIGLSKNEILAIIAFLQQMSGEPISVNVSELEIPGKTPAAPVKSAEAALVADAHTNYEAMRKALIAVNNALGHKMNSELGDMVDSALALAEGKEPS